VPYDVYIHSDKRPVVNLEADRVEQKDGGYWFYVRNEVVAMFKEETVVGYIKLGVLPENERGGLV
jgi:hypothetical protein